jgi:hypothetical protein
MSTTTTTTTTTAATVQSCISSIFSKEDVLKLLQEQEAELLASASAYIMRHNTYKPTRKDLLELAESISEAFVEAIDRGVDNIDTNSILDCVEIELNGRREIELSMSHRSFTEECVECITFTLPTWESIADCIEEGLCAQPQSTTTQTNN